MIGEPSLNKQPQQAPVEEEGKFVPADTAELNKAKRDFFEKKLVQYEERLKQIEKSIDFVAPEILSEYSKYYDTLAKMAAAKLLLSGGTVSKHDVEAFVRNSAQEHWDEVYAHSPSELAGVMRDHEQVIQEAVKQGWGVMCAYNEGRMDAIHGSQAV